MATKRTSYQVQADHRIKAANSQRTRSDAKVRRYAELLRQALATADDAKARLDRVNTLYGTSYSDETTLVHDLRTAGLSAAITTALGASTSGAPVLAVLPTADANSGVVLAGEAVFGEALTAGGTPTPTPAPTYDTTLNGPNGSAAGVTLAAQAGDAFGFNALTTGTSAPATMDVYVSGTQVASVAYLDRYNGHAFTFTGGSVGSTPHTGTFAATVNF